MIKTRDIRVTKKLKKSDLLLQRRFIKMQKRQLFQTESRFAEFIKASEDRAKEKEEKVKAREKEEIERKKRRHKENKSQPPHDLKDDILRQMRIMPEIE